MKRTLVMLVGLMLGAAAIGAPWPYDEKADAGAAVQQALHQAQAEGKNVLLIFGANWCEDCRDLDKALHRSKSDLVKAHFVVVKINVGQFDRNMDLAERYGNPTKQGIPAAVVLSAANTVLYATKGGELANARTMSDDSIYQFFAQVIGELPAPGT